MAESRIIIAGQIGITLALEIRDSLDIIIPVDPIPDGPLCALILAIYPGSEGPNVQRLGNKSRRWQSIFTIASVDYVGGLISRGLSNTFCMLANSEVAQVL